MKQAELFKDFYQKADVYYKDANGKLSQISTQVIYHTEAIDAVKELLIDEKAEVKSPLLVLLQGGKK